MTDAETLRALAARCCAGETGWKLQRAILEAMGWEYVEADHVWAKFIPPDDYENRTFMQLPNPITDLSASAAAMPAGWLVDVMIDADWTSVTTRRASIGGIGQADAPTEPLARTAAALMARAAEMETANG